MLSIEEVQHDHQKRRYVYLWSRERHLKSIEMKDELHLIIRASNSTEIIGYVILSGLEGKDDVISLDRIALKHKGKGYGRKCVRLIKELCFNKLNCNRLWLDVFEYNERAIKLYISEGFTHEGTLRKCKKHNNQYYSLNIMSILREEY